MSVISTSILSRVKVQLLLYTLSLLREESLFSDDLQMKTVDFLNIHSTEW